MLFNQFIRRFFVSILNVIIKTLKIFLVPKILGINEYSSYVIFQEYIAKFASFFNAIFSNQFYFLFLKKKSFNLIILFLKFSLIYLFLSFFALNLLENLIKNKNFIYLIAVFSFSIINNDFYLRILDTLNLTRLNNYFTLSQSLFQLIILILIYFNFVNFSFVKLITIEYLLILLSTILVFFNLLKKSNFIVKYDLKAIIKKSFPYFWYSFLSFLSGIIFITLITKLNEVQIYSYGIYLRMGLLLTILSASINSILSKEFKKENIKEVIDFFIKNYIWVYASLILIISSGYEIIYFYLSKFYQVEYNFTIYILVFSHVLLSIIHSFLLNVIYFKELQNSYFKYCYLIFILRILVFSFLYYGAVYMDINLIYSLFHLSQILLVISLLLVLFANNLILNKYNVVKLGLSLSFFLITFYTYQLSIALKSIIIIASIYILFNSYNRIKQ